MLDDEWEVDDSNEKAAFNMFAYQYTKLGWSIEWCKEVFATDYDKLKTEYMELADIALETYLFYMYNK
jgi:hypothetical protein